MLREPTNSSSANMGQLLPQAKEFVSQAGSRYYYFTDNPWKLSSCNNVQKIFRCCIVRGTDRFTDREWNERSFEMLGEQTSNVRLNNDVYSNVRNYDSLHMTPCYNNKSHKSHDFSMRKVINVFSGTELAQLLQFCDQSPPVEVQEGRDNDRVLREFLFRRNVSFIPVTFNEQGIPSILGRAPSSILNPQLSFPETIDKCILVGLERFGREMGWKGVTKNIACNIVRSRLPAQEEITLLDWHNDFEADHSFVVTLDNPHGRERGWQGGRFCYAAEAVINYSLPEVFESNLSATRDSRHPTWTLSVDQNEAVLFANHHTLHFVSPMKAYSKDNSPVNRTILTFFEYNTRRRKEIPHINQPQPVSTLSASLTDILSSYKLPTEIQQKASQHVVALEELAQTINGYKSECYLVDFYDAIQSEKLKMQKIADSLENLLSPYDRNPRCSCLQKRSERGKKQSKQIKEKILEWIYNS